MVLWFVRVVLVGKGPSLYDIVLWDHVCIGKEKSLIGYLKGIRRARIWRFNDHALNSGMDFELNLIYDWLSWCIITVQITCTLINQDLSFSSKFACQKPL